MRYFLTLLAILVWSCQKDSSRGVEAKIKCKLVFDNQKSYNNLKILYLTTVFKNNTDKDIYLYQLGSTYLMVDDTESKGEYNLIDTLKFDTAFFEKNGSKFINAENYVQNRIKNDIDKSFALDEFLGMNKLCIQKEYKSAVPIENNFIFLKKGEEIEVNNYPIKLFNTDADKIKYRVFIRERSILDEYKKNHSCYSFPEKIGKFELFNGKIKSDTLEIDYDVIKPVN